MSDEDDEPRVKVLVGANAEAEKLLNTRDSDAIKAVVKVRGWGGMASARVLPMAMVGAGALFDFVDGCSFFFDTLPIFDGFHDSYLFLT